MRKKIFISFVLIFTLFLTGCGIMIYNLIQTTSHLRYLIGLHEIEDIRQDLFGSVQRVSSYIYSSPDIFSAHLDEIIASSLQMEKAVQRCNYCHHEPSIKTELTKTKHMVAYFQEQLSYLITITADIERRKKKQEEVYQASTAILQRVEEMVNRAAATILRETEKTMTELEQVYILVAATLFATIILSLVVAGHLSGSITRPIQGLLESTRKIAAGRLGEQADIEATDEFRELVDAFNSMSISLAHKQETEKQHLEKLRQAQQQLIEAEKLTALGTMAGGIAHDFNNILCGMLGHLHILSRQIPADENHLKTIRIIEQAGFRAAELVKQLLTFARRKTMEIAVVDLRGCVNRVLDFIDGSTGGQLAILREIEEGLPPVKGDAGQLEQVIFNLCANARDAMPDSGTLTITCRSVIVDDKFTSEYREARPGRYVLLRVEDTGSGIDEKILTRIFDPFFTTKEVGKGTGLGLAIVYGIVKSHDGFCLIESTPGSGTAFSVYLPAAEREHLPFRLPDTAAPIGERTILVIDDEAVVTSMLDDYLRNAGYKTYTASDGRQGVEIFREHRDEVDLVILDIVMPVMNGREVYRELIRIKPEVLVLISSGFIMHGETRKILNMGAQGFLQKPYNLNEVNRRIWEILDCGRIA